MKSIEIGKSAVVASQAALGVMRMDALDADAAAEVVRTAAEHGVNFFDTADIYGFNVNHDHASSRVLGRAWKDAGLKREDIFLQTKFGINIDFSDPNNMHATRYDFSAKHLITRLDEELEALGTDYVDFALLHRPDTLMEAEEIVEAFTTLHKAGKVRHFGVSNFTPAQFALLQSRLPFTLATNQVEISPVHQPLLLDGTLDQLQQLRIRPMAWSCLGGGRLFNDDEFQPLRNELETIARELNAESIEQVVYAWILRLPSKPLPIIGSGKIERVRSALAAEELEMTRQQWFRIRKAALGYDVP